MFLSHSTDVNIAQNNDVICSKNMDILYVTNNKKDPLLFTTILAGILLYCTLAYNVIFRNTILK